MNSPLSRRAAAALCLQGAAEEGDLDSDSSESLQLGLMGMAASAVAVHLIHREFGWGFAACCGKSLSII